MSSTRGRGGGDLGERDLFAAGDKGGRGDMGYTILRRVRDLRALYVRTGSDFFSTTTYRCSKLSTGDTHSICNSTTIPDSQSQPSSNKNYQVPGGG